MPNRPPIVLFHPSDELYGADRILLEVCRSLPKGTCRVILPTDVMYPEKKLSQTLSAEGVEVSIARVPVLRREFLRLKCIPRLVRDLCSTISTLHALRPLHVHLNTSAMLMLAWPARLLGARTTVHVHEVWRRRERVFLGLLALPSHSLLCVSKASWESLPPFVRSRATVLYNGVTEPQTDACAAGPEPIPITFVVASRWNSWKGHKVLFEAWQRVLDVEPRGRRLVILGGPPASGQVVDVPALRKRLSLPETVSIQGEVSNVGDFLSGSHCVIVPSSLPDPLPTIAIEAAAMSRCVIASDLGGLPEIVEHGVTGLLVPPEDPAALASAILGADAEDLLTLGRSGRARYEQLFSQSSFRDRISAFFGAEVEAESAE